MRRLSLLIIFFFCAGEIVAFSLLGSQMGFGLTILIAVLTSFLGLFVLRIYGFSLSSLQQQMAGEKGFILDNLLSNLHYALASFLLILPGYITDVLGIAVLFLSCLKYFKNGTKKSSNIDPSGFGTRDKTSTKNSRPIIEGEFYDLTNINDPDNHH